MIGKMNTPHAGRKEPAGHKSVSKRKEEKRKIDKTQNSKRQISKGQSGERKKLNNPWEWYVVQWLKLEPYILRDRHRKLLESLHLTKKSEPLIWQHWYKKLKRAEIILAAFCLLGTFSLISAGMKEVVLYNGKYLNRPEEGELTLALEIYGEGLGKETVTVRVREPYLEEEEISPGEGADTELKKSTKAPDFLETWKEAFEKTQEQSKEKEYLLLPETIDGKKIIYRQEKKHDSIIFFFLGAAGAVLGFFSLDQNLLEQEKKRNHQLTLDYPEIVSKFALLIGAGMTIGGAWDKIARGYAEKKKNGYEELRYGYEEMLITVQEIGNGTAEVKAYEAFGRRIGRLEYLKFSTLISQNLRKGSREILNLLELEASDAFEKRKDYAKKQGEEAGTKLLLPMVLMLIIVFCIILVPAFMGF